MKRTKLGKLATSVALAAISIGTATGQQSASLPDPESFRNPPADARPQTLYFWMNGNVTRQGLDADLDAIARVGMGGVLVFDGSDDVPKGPVDYLSPQWLGLMTHMMDKADTLSLKVGMHNAPGWSSSGGPWIAPAQAMQQIVWTETSIAGGKRLRLALPKPYAKLDYYKDAAVLAFPASDGDESRYRDAIAGMRVGKGVDARTLTDRDLHSAIEIAPDTPLVISMKTPFPAQAVTLYAVKDAPGFSATIEASDDGSNWTRIGKVSVAVERGIEAPGTLNFARVSARHFRVTPSAKVKLAEALFHATPRIEDWDTKGEHGIRIGSAVERHPSNAARPDAIDPSRVIDISAKVDSRGMLDWTPPAGRWTILRFGHTPTGKLNVAASDAGRGLEVDKLNIAAVDHQFESSVGRVIKAAGPHAGKAFDMLEIDSFEAGMQNWTPTMLADFQKRNGYSLLPYLPTLTGRIVGDADVSDRVLYDYRRTLADLMADNYYGRMQSHANAAGLRFHAEGYGPGAFDALQVSGRAQVPMTEFWSRTPWTDNRTVKMVSSAAHVYGKPVVAAEAFTGEAQTSRWLDYPYAMKTLGDQMFAQGVNQFYFHRYAHQPNPLASPGMAMGPWGINLERSNTWFAQSRPWMEYLGRSQYMLRQGRNVADILYFVGEESPNQSEYLRPDISPDSNPKIGQYFSPQVPAGYSYDMVNAEVLLTRASVKDGRILLPDGASYRMLVMPDTIASMTPQLAQRLRDLVRQGMVMLAPKPARSLTMAGQPDGDAAFRAAIDDLWGTQAANTTPRRVGEGRIFATGGIAPVLADMDATPDVACETASPDGQVVWLHRRLADGDVYFVANRQRRAERLTCTFRVSGKAPALWDAESGAISRPALFDAGKSTTRVAFDLSPAGSTFVSFREPVSGAKRLDWVAKDGARFTDLDARTPVVAAPSDSFTLSLWAKPDIDLRLMPKESVDGRINETGKNYLVNARSGRDTHGDGTAVAGLAIGRNGAFVIERISPDSVPAVLVSHQPIAGWSHIALVYDKGTPSLYIDGKLAHTGLKSGRTVFAGGSDKPSPSGVTYSFEGNATPLRTDARALAPAEIAAEAAKGPPAPMTSLSPAEINRADDGSLRALVWDSGRYTTSAGRGFRADVPAPHAIDGPWTVRLQPGRGAPAQITLPGLQSLSHHPDPAVRHFSGTATYERNINVPASAVKKGQRVYLDLGRVEILSGVSVNGRDLGVVWKEPYRVDVTDVVHAGVNSLSLTVTNLWANRMIADAALPEEGRFVDNADWTIGERASADGKMTPVMARKIVELPDWYKAGKAKPEGGRVTFTPWTFFQANEPLLDSGLLGPVRLVFAQDISLK
ncbi:glycosyl hydrolase [Sphingobium aromaticiconvertens]|uniref:glycosyl hydrolase n=1 Tax=Sphingobium aromaticiconvertens TaxID=365341 RepID=UPI003019F674